jgi:hypothetical protein
MFVGKDSESAFFFFQEFVNLLYQLQHLFRILLAGNLSAQFHPAFSFFTLHGTGILTQAQRVFSIVPNISRGACGPEGSQAGSRHERIAASAVRISE